MASKAKGKSIKHTSTQALVRYLYYGFGKKQPRMQSNFFFRRRLLFSFISIRFPSFLYDASTSIKNEQKLSFYMFSFDYDDLAKSPSAKLKRLEKTDEKRRFPLDDFIIE